MKKTHVKRFYRKTDVDIYIYISGHKWSKTQRVLKSHRSKVSIIYMQSWGLMICGDSCNWAHDVLLHVADTNEPKSAPQAKQGA